jgi:PAS domain S-box-containing protein/putative nucleotidyltransferase with HDIG domain
MSTILVVDDLEQNRYLLRTMLTAAGFEVLEAANGAEALELARRTLPGLIISDILMPQMDGFALCREWKRDERLRDIPFVFCTATYTDPRDETLALQLGAARFIAKPIESETLLAIVREVLQAPASEERPAIGPELEEEETAFFRLYNEALIRKLEDKMLDLERLNRRLAESEGRFRRLAENAPDLIYRYEFTPKRGFAYVSPAATAITGYTPEEYYADPGLGVKLVHPEDLALSEEATNAKAPSNQPLTLRWVRKDGETIWTEQRNAPVFNQDGDTVGIEGIVRDVTARRQRERELEAIAAMSAALRAVQTRSEMLPVILDQLLSILKVGAALLAMLDPTNGELHAELARGEWADLTGETIPSGEGLSAEILATGQPLVNNDASNDPRVFRLPAGSALRAAAGAPLVVQGQIIGLMWVGSRRLLTDHDLRLLIAIAEMTASAIHRAALYEETAHRVEQLEALKSIDRAITGSLDLRLTLSVLLEPVATQLKADAAAVLLLDPHLQTLDFAAGRGFRTRGIQNAHVRLGEEAAGRVALERRAVQVNDVAQLRQRSHFSALWAAEGFAAYCGVPLIVKGRVKGVLEVYHRTQFHPDPDWLGFLDALAGQAAIAIDNGQLFENLDHANTELGLAYESTIEGWSHAMDIRDKETEGHSLRVTEMTLRLAKAMDMGDAELVHVRRGALLHDIGKMGVPDAILLKPGKLTEDEWTLMRAHPRLAYELISPINYLRPALDIPYCHHEKWDGTGYPRGLKAEQIPLAARIFAVVDVWDALRSDRPYRAAWPEDKVLEHIRSLAGTHFEPRAVELFLRVVNDFA